jgi:hypothetical protein
MKRCRASTIVLRRGKEADEGRPACARTCLRRLASGAVLQLDEFQRQGLFDNEPSLLYDFYRLDNNMMVKH